MTRQGFNWREFLWLSIAGVVGVVLMIPYSLTLQAPKLKELPIPLQVLIPIQVVQNAIFIAIAVGVGLLLAKRTGLGAPLLEAWLSGERIGQRLKAIHIPLAEVTLAGATRRSRASLPGRLLRMPEIPPLFNRAAGCRPYLAYHTRRRSDAYPGKARTRAKCH
jgi:hypothetical protein